MCGYAVVADDDETIRSILRYKLGSEGFDLEVYADGAAARDALDETGVDPDVVILDVMMPKLQGTRVLQMARRGELAVDPDVPILMLTSRGREDDVLAGLESGADEYITKPFSPAELLARVEKLIG
jgi:DNA-binding response OmpR family regulator